MIHLSIAQQHVLLAIHQLRKAPEDAFQYLLSDAKIHTLAVVLMKRGLLHLTRHKVHTTKKGVNTLIHKGIIAADHTVTKQGATMLATPLHEHSAFPILTKVLQFSSFL